MRIPLMAFLVGVTICHSPLAADDAVPLDTALVALQREDYPMALRILRELAQAGNRDAQFELATMYEYGLGIPANQREAAKWLLASAELGLAAGQNNLAVRYENGSGVLQDFVAAHKWYNLASAEIGEIARQSRDRVATQMTSEQIAEAQRLAGAWKPHMQGAPESWLSSLASLVRRVPSEIEPAELLLFAGVVIAALIGLWATTRNHNWKEARKDIQDLGSQVIAYYQLEMLYKNELSAVDPQKRAAKTILEQMRTRVSQQDTRVRPSMTDTEAKKRLKRWT